MIPKLTPITRKPLQKKKTSKKKPDELAQSRLKTSARSPNQPLAPMTPPPIIIRHLAPQPTTPSSTYPYTHISCARDLGRHRRNSRRGAPHPKNRRATRRMTRGARPAVGQQKKKRRRRGENRCCVLFFARGVVAFLVYTHTYTCILYMYAHVQI